MLVLERDIIIIIIIIIIQRFIKRSYLALRIGHSRRIHPSAFIHLSLNRSTHTFTLSRLGKNSIMIT